MGDGGDVDVRLNLEREPLTGANDAERLLKRSDDQPAIRDLPIGSQYCVVEAGIRLVRVVAVGQHCLTVENILSRNPHIQCISLNIVADDLESIPARSGI